MKLFGLAGWSGSGKTTLAVALLEIFTARGLRVSTVKHAHHDFDVDQPGKDSYRHRQAGAVEVMVSSANRFALMHELRGAPEPELGALLQQMSAVDLVLVEGFKREKIDKLEIHRSVLGKPLLAPDDPHIIAIATDATVEGAALPVLSLDRHQVIADFILAHVGLD